MPVDCPAVRTNGSGGGRNVNDILALFDKVGDPFSGAGGTAKPGEAKPGDNKPSEAANMVADAALQNAATVFQPKPAETNAKTGFDREDRATLTQKPPPATDTKSSSDQKQQSKEPSRESREQTLGSQAQGLANKLQDSLQKGLAAFAKLASFGKGAEGAEPDPHVVPHAKDSAKTKDKHSGGAGSAAPGEAHAAEAHNFASHTTEGAPSDAKPAKAEKEEHIEQFREELRSAAGERGDRAERGERGEAKKLDKPRDGKEPHELVKGDVVNDSQELRELVGGWKSEHCALEEEQKHANALRIEDALGEQMRCRGMLDDGSRCIRKPVMGIPYCREHASAVYAGEAGFVSIGAGVEPSKGPVEVTEPEAVAYTDPPEEVADPTLPETPVYVVTD